MNQWLSDILINPDTSSPLSYESNTNTLSDSTHNKVFQVKNNIPIFTDELVTTEKTDVHHSFNSNFNYLEHYQNDAVVFDYFKEDTHPATVHELKRFRQSVISKVPKEAQLLLDVGSGSAWLADNFTKKGKHVVSLDISYTNIEKALKKCSSPLHSGVVADSFHLPFAENTFDCIVACEIMEHTYNPQLFVNALYKVLKPGGTLIITTPYKEKIEYYLCVHCNKPTPKNAHLHSFDKKAMEILSKELDFERREISTTGNSLLTKLRTHVFFNIFGFNFWKVIDSFFNMITDKGSRIILLARKKS